MKKLYNFAYFVRLCKKLPYIYVKYIFGKITDEIQNDIILKTFTVQAAFSGLINEANNRYKLQNHILLVLLQILILMFTGQGTNTYPI